MKRILVCGDAMVDRYVYGEITRMSPEAIAVPVFKAERFEQRDGAAANVVANIRAMGGDVMFRYSRTCWDDDLWVTKTRYVVGGKQWFRADEDRAQDPLDPVLVLEDATKDNCDIVVLSDYGKGTLDNIEQIIWALKQAGKTVIVDPKSRRLHSYAGADWLKPNVEEMRMLVGRWNDEEELEFKVKALQRAAKIPNVLLTRGAQGMTLYASARYDYKAMPVKVADVCGAGDTAIAALAVSLALGHDAHTAAFAANVAAGISVTKFGTAVVTKEEVFG
jgi:rfaE bifunctional protein kinase chain/domain